MEKKDAFDRAGTRAQVPRLPVDRSNHWATQASDISFSTGRTPHIAQRHSPAAANDLKSTSWTRNPWFNAFCAYKNWVLLVADFVCWECWAISIYYLRVARMVNLVCWKKIEQKVGLFATVALLHFFFKFWTWSHLTWNLHLSFFSGNNQSFQGHVILKKLTNFLLKIWKLVEKIQTDVGRLLLILKLKKVQF